MWAPHPAPSRALHPGSGLALGAKAQAAPRAKTTQSPGCLPPKPATHCSQVPAVSLPEAQPSITPVLQAGLPGGEAHPRALTLPSPPAGRHLQSPVCKAFRHVKVDTLGQPEALSRILVPGRRKLGAGGPGEGRPTAGDERRGFQGRGWSLSVALGSSLKPNTPPRPHRDSYFPPLGLGPHRLEEEMCFLAKCLLCLICLSSPRSRLVHLQP